MGNARNYGVNLGNGAGMQGIKVQMRGNWSKDKAEKMEMGQTGTREV